MNKRGTINIQDVIWNQKPGWVTQIMLKSRLCKEICQKANVPTDGPSGGSWVVPEVLQGQPDQRTGCRGGGETWAQNKDLAIHQTSSVHSLPNVSRTGRLGTPEPSHFFVPEKQEQRHRATWVQVVNLRRNCKEEWLIKVKVCRQKPLPLNPKQARWEDGQWLRRCWRTRPFEKEEESWP